MRYELKRVSIYNTFELKIDLYDENSLFGFDIVLSYTKHSDLEKARRLFIKLNNVALPLAVWEILFAYTKGAMYND